MTGTPKQQTVDDLLAIMAALRTPMTGCPWDLAQSFATIAPYTIEEAYEVADAIARNDLDDLKDELGDLLLQVVYHAQLASEIGVFGFADVVAAISEKMVRRHPHVFGDASLASAASPPDSWETIKAEEKRTGAASPARAETAGALGGMPLALPALTRAMKLQRRAARVGFDWPTLEPVIAKAHEELGELEAALATQAPRVMREAELGDLLFAVVNLARHLEIDPEAALRGASAKFERRFRRIEALLGAQGRSPDDADLAELDRLWDAAKAEERERGDGAE